MSEQALMMNGMTAEEWVTCSNYVGDPLKIVGVITVTDDGGISLSSRHGPSATDDERAVKTRQLDEVVEWGMRGRDWQKAALIGIPSALVLAGLAGWYFGGRKCRRR